MNARDYARVAALALILICLPVAQASAASSAIYVSAASGNDANSGTSLASAVLTIQRGIDLVAAGGTVYIEPGTYTGAGDNDLDFDGSSNQFSGRDITVTSDPSNGGSSTNTIIDIAATDALEANGFVFDSGETSASVLNGLTITNGNEDDASGGAVVISDGSSVTIENCAFDQNIAAYGGAIDINDSSATIVNCQFIGNQSYNNSAASSPTGDLNTYYGGAIELSLDSAASGTYTSIITNCVFTSNVAPSDGAAIDISGDEAPAVLAPIITNCTFTDNITTATDGAQPGGAVGVLASSPTFTNCILYGDTGGEIATVSEVPNSSFTGLQAAPPASVTTSYSDIGQAGFTGSGNLDADPDFAGNLSLAVGSPCINAGTTSVPSGVNIATDILGNPRGSFPDMGAYQYVLLLSALSLSGFENGPVSGVVATFNDSSEDLTPLTDLAGTINWGDGTVSAGTVTQSGGAGTLYVVSGAHTYTTTGSFGMLVTVTANTNAPAVSASGAATNTITVPVPSAPSNVSATAGPGQITVTWTGSTNANVYALERGGTSGGPYAIITSVPATVANTYSYVDTGRTAGKTYYYVVVAVNTTYNTHSGPSAEVSAVPLAALTAPTSVAAKPGPNQITLTWTGSSAANQYEIERGQLSGGPYGLVATVPSGAGNNYSYVDSGRIAGKTYYYVILAQNTVNNTVSPQSAQVSATPYAPPGVPTNVVATGGPASITITWNGSANANEYELERGGTSGGPYGLIATLPTTTNNKYSYLDTGRTVGKTYYYIVIAVSTVNNAQSAPSAQVSAVPVPALSPPTNVVAAGGSGEITVSWTGSTGANEYELERGAASGGPYGTLVATLPSNGSNSYSYVDSGRIVGKTYYYVVIALNTTNNTSSSPSAQASAVATP